jgi:hypothetical protein
MKNILYIIAFVFTLTSCKTREILSKGTISEYNLTDENLIGTEVYITDPVRMVFDTTVVSPDNKKGFISVKESQIIDRIKIRVQCKGRIETVEYIGKKLVLGVLFERKAQPIYFVMNKKGFIELYLDKNKILYDNHKYELVSTEIPYLEVIIKRNKVSNRTKMIMTGY